MTAEIDRISTSTEFNGVKPLAAGNNMTFQIGATKDETLKVTSQAMDSQTLGVKNITVDSVANANTAIDTINKAIDTVSGYRAQLGAAQNRMEHTINNLKVTSENVTAAESRIRDTDMADEMTSYTKNNILMQAAQSMLAQSNSMPQGVLNMLQ